MTLDTVRGTLLASLQTTDALATLKPAQLEAYAQGRRDIALRELAMDSLARMEMLIALELEHDAVIPPDDFARFRSLDEIANHVLALGAGVRPQAAPHDTRDADQRSSATSDVQPDRDLPSVVRLYRRVVRMCRTVAQLDRVHASLEHRLTPQELADLLASHREGRLIPGTAAEKFHRSARSWFEHQARDLRASGTPEPAPFVSRRIYPTVRLFSGPGARADKTLVLLFTGNGRRVMISHAALLQHVDARLYDVLVVVEARDSGYRAGVPLLGRNLYEVVESVTRLPLIREYPRLRTLGLSSGGYPAILAGRRLGAELSLSVCGRFPAERHVIRILTMLYRLWITTPRNPGGHVLLSAEEDRSRDKNFSRVVAWLTGGRRIGVRTSGAALGHLMLQPLLERGRLGAFLQHCLFTPLERGWLVDTTGTVLLDYPVRADAQAVAVDTGLSAKS